MTQKTKRIIALIELAVVLVLVAYFFLPRHLDGAMGGDFDQTQVTEIQAVLTDRDGKTQTITLPSGTPMYEDLLILLNSKQYQPYYVGTEARETTLPAQVHLTFVLPETTYYLSFSGDPAIDVADSTSRLRTFRVSQSETFQQAVLDLLLTQGA